MVEFDAITFDRMNIVVNVALRQHSTLEILNNDYVILLFKGFYGYDLLLSRTSQNLTIPSLILSYCSLSPLHLKQGILKGEVSLYH